MPSKNIRFSKILSHQPQLSIADKGTVKRTQTTIPPTLYHALQIILYSIPPNSDPDSSGRCVSSSAYCKKCFGTCFIAPTTCSDGTIVSNTKCCALVPLLQDLKDNFFGVDERCPALVSYSFISLQNKPITLRIQARSVLRLAFHDAIGFSVNSSTFAGGGADGSILVFDDVELEDPANNGLHVVVFLLQRLMEQYSISPGDLSVILRLMELYLN